MAEYKCNLSPEDGANIYYRGRWEYCPEYNRGDVTLCDGVLYLCIEAHAGKDPKIAENRKYWQAFGYSDSPVKPEGKIVLDGGFSTTSASDRYACDYFGADGGSSNSRVNIPLI